MNQSDKGSAAASALSIIRTIVDLRGQNLSRPVLVRFAWFCVGAIFVLASVRPTTSGPEMKPELEPQAANQPNQSPQNAGHRVEQGHPSKGED